jgi:hypothetical protein
MTHRTHRLLLAALAALLAGLGLARAGSPPVRNVAEWNLGKGRLAIQGYDPVAYFPEGGGVATPGDPNVTAELGGVVYRFASPAHRATFLANPSRYEPSHGGWCSYAMLEGDKVQVDPKSFIVKDGRLFLFYKGFLGDTRAKWLKADTAAETKTADAMWKTISGETAREEKPMSDSKPSREELKKKLTPEQFEVVCNAASLRSAMPTGTITHPESTSTSRPVSRCSARSTSSTRARVGPASRSRSILRASRRRRTSRWAWCAPR